MKKIIFVFLPVLSVSVFSQNKSKDVDSLINLLPSRQNEELVDLTNDIAQKCMWDIQDYKRAKTYAESALSQAEKLNYRNGRATAFYTLGSIKTDQEMYDDAIGQLNKGLALLNAGAEPDTKEILTKAFTLLVLGKAYAGKSNISKGSYYQLEALKIYESESEKNIAAAADYMNEKGFPVSAAKLSMDDVNSFKKKFPGDTTYIKILKRGKKIISNLRNTYFQLGKYFMQYKDYKTSLFYFQKGKQNAEYYRSDGWYKEILGFMGDLYMQQNIYDSAIVYYKKCVVQSEKENDVQSVVIRLQSTAQAEIKNKNPKEALACYEKIREFLRPFREGNFTGRKVPEGMVKLIFEWQTAVNNNNIAEVYFSLGTAEEIKKARQFQDTALSIYEKVIPQLEKAKYGQPVEELYWELGLLYGRRGDNVKSVKYLCAALPLYLKNEDSENLIPLYKDLSNAYEKTGDIVNSYKYFKKLIALKDSVFSQKSANEIAQLQKRFEVETKDSQIDILNIDKEKNQAEIEKQKLVRNIIIGGLGIVLVLVTFVIRSNLQRKKANRLLEEKNVLIDKQKHEVEEKQKELLDSIYYARRIQRALITNEKYIGRKLNDLNKN